MKKVELIVILLIWVILWGGVVWYYNKQPKAVIETPKNKEITKNVNQNLQDKLNKLEIDFKNFSKWKTYVQLIKDKNYQAWVKNINNLLEQEKKAGHKNNLDYIYYNFMAMVVEKYLPNYSKLEKDLVIQSIKRIDFNTLTDKNYYTQLMKDYVDIKYYKPALEEIKNVDKKKLDTDKKYFYKIILDPTNWFFYRIFKNRYDWNKTWIGFKPEFLENQFVDFLSQRFEQILAKLWYDKLWFKKKVFEYYNINSLEQLRDLINQDFNNINKKYNLDNLWIPTDRFFRHDERRELFKKDGLHKKLYTKLWNHLDEFKKDIKEFRLKMYLLSYLGKDINLFNSHVRAKFLNPDEWFGIQNLFRVWRYVDEVLKLDLKPEVK